MICSRGWFRFQVCIYYKFPCTCLTYLSCISSSSSHAGLMIHSVAWWLCRGHRKQVKENYWTPLRHTMQNDEMPVTIYGQDIGQHELQQPSSAHALTRSLGAVLTAARQCLHLQILGPTLCLQSWASMVLGCDRFNRCSCGCFGRPRWLQQHLSNLGSAFPAVW